MDPGACARTSQLRVGPDKFGRNDRVGGDQLIGPLQPHRIESFTAQGPRNVVHHVDVEAVRHKVSAVRAIYPCARLGASVSIFLYVCVPMHVCVSL
jgi:hypothetical protein